MSKSFSKTLKILGLIGGLFILAFGNVGNFWRTVRLALGKKNK